MQHLNHKHTLEVKRDALTKHLCKTAALLSYPHTEPSIPFDNSMREWPPIGEDPELHVASCGPMI